jgi:transcriptional regulator with XRE-family HTH domain
MSINLDTINPPDSGFPELTELGKRIEVLRIQRGMSKQLLAKHAGTSRQQLWRVMTGKSELTPTLRQRLSDVLGIAPQTLATATASIAFESPILTRSTAASTALTAAPTFHGAVSLAEFVEDPSRLELVLRLLPSGEDGRRLKRMLLNGLEDVAMERGVHLGVPFFELRRRVLAGDL